MALFDHGYGLIFSVYILGALAGLFAARMQLEARNNEDDLYHDDGMPEMEPKEYRRHQLQAVTIFPLVLMTFLLVASTPLDAAPGLVPLWADRLARIIFSVGAVVLIFPNGKRLIQSIRWKNENRLFAVIRFLVATCLFSVASLYPWILRNSPWWRTEAWAISISIAAAVLLGFYVKHKTI